MSKQRNQFNPSLCPNEYSNSRLHEFVDATSQATGVDYSVILRDRINKERQILISANIGVFSPQYRRKLLLERYNMVMELYNLGLLVDLTSI